MKQFIYLLAFAFMSANASAQEAATQNNNFSITNFKVVHNAGNLLITWSSTLPDGNNYWEVLGSVDGKTFKTIGLVLGSHPVEKNQYAFKQSVVKPQPGYQYFRVAQIQPNHTGLASSAIQVTK